MKPEFNKGETPLNHAPQIRLKNGGMCVPQHYLEYAHSRESVEALLQDINFSERYIPFACGDAGGVYVQIGIIGYDNYKSHTAQAGRKIVFGRCWRIEPNLPTSEIIQTVFLAIKKAREHEIRELFCIERLGKSTTPFNNHHDLPLMARNQDLLTAPLEETDNTSRTLSTVKFDDGKFTLDMLERRHNGTWIIDLNYTQGSKGELGILMPQSLTLMLDSLSANALYHALLAKCLNISDRDIDERFTYKGFARFNRNVDILAISDLSADTRKLPASAKQNFTDDFESSKYETDSGRAPKLYGGEYSERVKTTLLRLNVCNGIMPVDVIA